MSYVFQSNLASKFAEAIIVSTTTQAKAMMPGSGWIVAMDPSLTSATRMATRKTSSMDHLPITSMHRTRVVLLFEDRVFQVKQRKNKPNIFASGMTIEQSRTSMAMPRVPSFQSSTVPLQIVDWVLYPSFDKERIGNRFAGIKSIKAAMENASVRWMPRGACMCKDALHFVHVALYPAGIIGTCCVCPQ